MDFSRADVLAEEARRLAHRRGTTYAFQRAFKANVDSYMAAFERKVEAILEAVRRGEYD